MKLSTLIKIAKILSKTDLKNYFKGKYWQNAEWKGEHEFQFENDWMVVRFEPTLGWKVKVWDVEDEDNFKSIESVDPIEEIQDFIGYESDPKTWKRTENPDGFSFKIGQEFEAELIRLYRYEFVFKHDNSANESGKTEDPIIAYEKWARGKIYGVIKKLRKSVDPQTIPTDRIPLGELEAHFHDTIPNL